MHHVTSKICLFKHEQKIMTMWSFISDWIFSCIKKTISSKLLNSLRCNFLLFSSVCVFSALFSSINKKNDDKKSHLHMKTEFLNSFSFSVLHSRTLRQSRDDKRQKQRLLFCRDATLYSDLMHQHVMTLPAADSAHTWSTPQSPAPVKESDPAQEGFFSVCLFLEIWCVCLIVSIN